MIAGKGFLRGLYVKWSPDKHTKNPQRSEEGLSPKGRSKYHKNQFFGNKSKNKHQRKKSFKQKLFLIKFPSNFTIYMSAQVEKSSRKVGLKVERFPKSSISKSFYVYNSSKSCCSVQKKFLLLVEFPLNSITDKGTRPFSPLVVLHFKLT